MMAKTLILPSSYINLNNQETNSNTNNSTKTLKGSNLTSSCTHNTAMTNEMKPNYKLNSSCSSLLLKHNGNKCANLNDHVYPMYNSMSNNHIHNQNKSNESNEINNRLNSDLKSNQTNKSNLKNQLSCTKLNKSSLHVGYLDNADDFNRLRKQLSRNHLDKYHHHNQPNVNHSTRAENENLLSNSSQCFTDNAYNNSNQKIKITNDNGDEMSLKEDSLNESNNQRHVNLSANGLSLLEEKVMSVSTPPTPTSISNQLEFTISSFRTTSTSSGSDENFLKLPSQSNTQSTQYLSPALVNKSQMSIDHETQPANKNKLSLFKTAFQSNSSNCLFQNSQTISNSTQKLDEKSSPAQTHQLNFKPSSSSICINHNSNDTVDITKRANNRLNKLITIAYNKKNLSPPFSLQTSELNLIRDASSMMSVDSHHSTCCSLTCADLGHVTNLNHMDNLSDFSDESLCELKTHILEPSVLHAHSTFSIYDLLLKKIELGLSNLNKNMENCTANSSLLDLEAQSGKWRTKNDPKCLVRYKTTDATRNEREYDDYDEEGSEDEDNVDKDCESMSNSGILCNNLRFIKSNNKKGLKSKSQSIANLQPSLIRHNKPEHHEQNTRHFPIYNRFFKHQKNHKSNKKSVMNSQESTLIRLLMNPQQNSDYVSTKQKRAEKQHIEHTSSSKSNQDLNSFITYNQLDDTLNNCNQTTQYTTLSNTNDENEDANEKIKFKYGSRKGSQSTSALDSIKVLNDLSNLKSTKSSVYLTTMHHKRSNQQPYRHNLHVNHQHHEHLYNHLNDMPFNFSIDDSNTINNNNSAKSSTYNLRTKASAM